MKSRKIGRPPRAFSRKSPNRRIDGLLNTAEHLRSQEINPKSWGGSVLNPAHRKAVHEALA